MATAVSRAVIEVLLDRVNQGAATLSEEARLTYANQRLATMLGVTRAQLVGKQLVELVAEADRPTLADALAAGHDTASQCRLAMPRSDGSGQLPALLTFAPLGHGQASCLVTDLSHEERMLGPIRHSLELLKRSSLEADARRAVESIERALEALNSKA